MGKKLGEVLIEAGLINIDDINEALEIQKSTGQKLGEILVNLNIVTQEELRMALDFQNQSIE